MKSYLLDITPDKAKGLLRTVKNNRSLQKTYAESLARDMARDASTWQHSPQGIVLDDAGAVLDGQHRLTAVVLSGQTVKFWVTEGADKQSFLYLDSGRGRSLADRLTIAGYSDPAQLAAIGRKISNWQTGQFWGINNAATRDEVQEIIDADPMVGQAAKYAHGWSTRPSLSPASAGFAWWLFSHIDSDDAHAFMEGIRTGAGLEMNSGVFRTRERITREMATINGRKIRQELLTAWMIIGWNAQRENRAIQKIQTPNPLTNANFPRPV